MVGTVVKLGQHRIVLATYNIHRCVGQDGRCDPHRIVEVLAGLHADVIALQEVDSRGVTGVDRLEWLADQLDYRPIAGPTLVHPDGRYGNAILTRLPILSVRRIDLSLARREPRGALDVDLDVHGHTLHVIATHLGLRPTDRSLQIKRLLPHFQLGQDRPSVLMGDLNEWFIWGRPMRRLQRLFGSTPAYRTFPAGFPVFPLDRIWVHPRSLLLNLTVHHTPLTRIASDHLPLTAVMRVNSRPAITSTHAPIARQMNS